MISIQDSQQQHEKSKNCALCRRLKRWVQAKIARGWAKKRNKTIEIECRFQRVFVLLRESSGSISRVLSPNKVFDNALR